MDDPMKDPPIPTFKSIEEECAYWKNRCSEIKRKLIETRQEFTDFEENSHELEAELEATLEQREKYIRDLKNSLTQIQSDNESLRKKISTFESDYNMLETTFDKLKAEHENLREHTRKVEQKNDDLERANRVVSATVTDLEAMLNQAYEKNEFLELEVEDKESLSAKHQRVLDELRDLKQEMNVKSPHTDEKSPPHSENLLNGNTPTPIASQKAFNIIADSLRRIDQKIQFQLSKLLCPTCDKLKFRCVCPKPMCTPSSTPNKLFDSTTTPTTKTTTTSSPSNNYSFQTNLFRTSKSTDSIDTDCTPQTTADTVDAATQRSSRLLSFQWSNVFNSRNSKSTSQLNLVNCDNNCIIHTDQHS